MGRTLKRIGKWVGILLLALVVFLAGSIVVDGMLGGSRLDAVTNVRVPGLAGGPEVRAFVARPSTPGPHPAVIMIHEFWGLNGDITGKAQALADEGYVVIAPDSFRGSTTGWVPRAIYQVVSTPQEQVASDLDAVYAWLEAQPDVQKERIGIMGFCFGGGTSLRYSLHNPRLAATVILYGSLITEREQLKALPAPVLGIFGGADATIPPEQVHAFETALEENGMAHEITVYEGQPHAFVSTIETIRQGGAPGQAWAQVVGFLKAHLQKNGSGARPAVEPVSVASGIDWGYVWGLAFEHTVAGGMHGH